MRQEGDGARGDDRLGGEAAEADELERDLRQREDGADRAAGDGALRHAPEARRVVLREDHARHALDGLRAQRPVAPGAGEDHADGAIAELLREGGEELIDGQVRARGDGAGDEAEAAPGDDEVGVGRDDVDAAGEHGAVVHRLLDGDDGQSFKRQHERISV